MSKKVEREVSALSDADIHKELQALRVEVPPHVPRPRLIKKLAQARGKKEGRLGRHLEARA